MTRITKINFILSLYWLRQFFVKSLSIQVTKVGRPMFTPIEWAIFSLLQGEKRTCRVEWLFNSLELGALALCISVEPCLPWELAGVGYAKKSGNKRASVRRTRAKTFYPCWFNWKENLGFAVKIAGAKVTKIKTNNQVFVRKTGNINFENKSQLKGAFLGKNQLFSGENLVK